MFGHNKIFHWGFLSTIAHHYTHIKAVRLTDKYKILRCDFARNSVIMESDFSLNKIFFNKKILDV